MKIQCQIWVGRISLLSVKTVLCIIYCGEVHLHVWVTLNNLNSFYKINTPSLRTVSLNVKLHSPQQFLLACLLTFSSLLTSFSYRIQWEVLTDIIQRVTQAHLLKIRKVLELIHHIHMVRKFRLKSGKSHDRSSSSALCKHPHFPE